MSARNRTKGQQFRRHAMQRAEERYGLSLEPSHLKTISEFILSGHAEEVEPEKGGRSLWNLNVNGKDVVVVFDHATKSPVTFLTRQMALNNLYRKGRKP